MMTYPEVCQIIREMKNRVAEEGETIITDRVGFAMTGYQLDSGMVALSIFRADAQDRAYDDFRVGVDGYILDRAEIKKLGDIAKRRKPAA